MKPLVLVSGKILPAGERLLEQYFRVKVLANGFNDSEQQNFFSEEPFGILTLLTDRIEEHLISKLPSSVRIISNHAVGFNNISIEACQRKGIIVANTPDVLTETTAEFTIALILNLSRRIPEGMNMIRDGLFTGWKPDLLLGCGLSGKTLGIIGPGRIGRTVAKMAEAFSLKVIFHGSKETPEFFAKEDLLKTADFVSLHVPLNVKTKHLLTYSDFCLMKKNAFVINTSRGECIKESDLLRALAEKRIAGAALDVFEFEPQVTKGLESFPNVILTPHIASATEETRTKMSFLAAQNIVNVYLGKEPLSRVI